MIFIFFSGKVLSKKEWRKW